jgi:putative addiction module component (TIGR02574 family)
MSERGARVLEEALSLPPAERIKLAERLLSSLEPPSRKRIDRLWAEEAEERVDAFEQGEINSTPAKSVFEGLRKKKTR